MTVQQAQWPSKTHSVMHDWLQLFNIVRMTRGTGTTIASRECNTVIHAAHCQCRTKALESVLNRDVIIVPVAYSNTVYILSVKHINTYYTESLHEHTILDARTASGSFFIYNLQVPHSIANCLTLYWTKTHNEEYTRSNASMHIYRNCLTQYWTNTPNELYNRSKFCTHTNSSSMIHFREARTSISLKHQVKA